MPDIIQLLPDSIANQIAAGEVVQRPASAVKELVENAIDAGATSIKLIIKDAGKTLLQVIDDGIGMSETDARMSLERHATSKIRKAEDLFTLHTMGFRGEALASIAAVSQLELRTRKETTELGTLLVVEGSAIKKQEPIAAPKGTNISVRNLFFNIPARRNFLKSNPVELRHIIDEFQRLALARPDIGFELIQEDDSIYSLPPTKLNQRIVSLFGKNYQEQLASCNEETSLVKVMGYVGNPASAKKTRGEQFIFVNNRFIKNNYLAHAVINAYDGLLQEASFPFYVLFIEIDPKHIDVNVHPTKTEIKFDDERAVYAVVRSAVRQALGSHNLTPTIDFNADVNIMGKIVHARVENSTRIYEEQFGNSLQQANLKNWEKLFDGRENESQLFKPSAEPLLRDEKTTLRFESAINQTQENIPHESSFFQLHNRYIVRSVRNGLMIIDQQLAHERILYDKYLMFLRGNAGSSQQSLFPQSIELSLADFALVMEIEAEIKALGFIFEIFGKSTLLISGIPADLSGNEKQLFEALIEQFKKNQTELSLPVPENLARSLAKRACIKSGQRLETEEQKRLVEGLFSSSNPNFSPDGAPTFFIFETSKIESYFVR